MDFQLDTDRKLIFWEANDFTEDKIFEALARLEELDPTNSFNVLIDRSHPTSKPLALSDIRQAEILLNRMRRLWGQRKIAAVLPAGVNFGVGRQVSAVMENLAITDYRPFLDRESAIAWLFEKEE